ncbi:hypothetical protein QBC47DRAFT_289166 [Echria macrotheca]|uniref:Zinc finger PHD-type domain-containing protein n=1 Tax=Echria macrotheca TaxID=438768 RepID=A0AAJ0BMT3_9PEZI|nr:hypothetical protein QBC47DRAFT_289166 [Echria macrotheca]
MTTASRRGRKIPFLHRNWIKATNFWETIMGNKSSAQSNEAAKTTAVNDPARRAAKRRRLDNDYDGFPLFEDHGSVTRALRIEVLKIFHKDSTRFKNGSVMNGLVPLHIKDVVQVKARCKLTISGSQAGQLVVLHVDSQVCDLKIFKSPANNSPTVRFASVQPFHVPEDKIYVERDDDAVFGLANTYTVLIELESAGDPNWPPQDLISVNDEEAFYLRGLPIRQWSFTASIPDIFNSRNRKEIQLRVRKQPHQETPTNFRMDVDVRWLTPISSQLRSHDKDIQPTITVFGPQEPIVAVNGTVTVNGVNGISRVNGVNGVHGMNGANGIYLHSDPLVNGVDRLVNGHGSEMALDQVEELVEGDTTPNRPQRVRAVVNYNDRENMARQLGKQPRKRRRADDDNNGQVDEHTVTYLLPPEQVQTDRFECLICGAENERLPQLRAHYLCHPQYEFHFEGRPRGGWSVRVTTVAGDNVTPLRPRVYQLGLPVKPLDLERFVEGDNSWVTSRLGPEDGHDLLAKYPHFKPQQKLVPRRTRKKVLVPNIKQQLFDPRSKVQLVPGTEVKQHPVDDAWLLRKHRDSLGDFVDVEPQEKEYMQEWDSYILKKHISSQQYLPRAFLGFVKEKAPWIVAKKSRSKEFSKHVAMLLARRAISEAVIVEATQRINDARLLQTDGEVEEPAPKIKSGSGCVTCGEPVPVSAMLLCANKMCKTRLYHVSCVEGGEEKMQDSQWTCGKCALEDAGVPV